MAANARALTDSDRIAISAMVIPAAECELEVIRILAAHAGLSAAARERIGDALDVIESALGIRRAEAGLQPRSAMPA